MQKKNNPIINILTEKLLFLGGVTKSGKSFLCPIISSFKKTEMFIIHFPMIFQKLLVVYRYS